MTRDLTREEEDWLAAAVIGTASEEEKAVAAALLADEETREAAKAEEAFLKALKSGVSEGAEDMMSPGAMGLQRLLRDIRAEKQDAGNGFSFAALPKAGRAFAVAASLALAVITGFTAARITGEEGSYRTAGLSEAGTLQVIFEPSAAEGEIRALLLEHDLEIVEGPSALGVYRLAQRGAQAQALEELRAVLAAKETLIQSVEIE
ncbi:conserved protein [Tepidicaulis marinus]|uniref:Conserved protein n=1 Tax=Tepidicaulis marinus TaxID=1333998 RepID=A0A081BEZ3_9HYPH|nr:hypothetical protein [Tepidicaulis marinus]GAK46611.1 conserved protein [Tepidicaulis marinus]